MSFCLLELQISGHTCVQPSVLLSPCFLPAFYNCREHQVDLCCGKPLEDNMISPAPLVTSQNGACKATVWTPHVICCRTPSNSVCSFPQAWERELLCEAPRTGAETPRWRLEIGKCTGRTCLMIALFSHCSKWQWCWKTSFTTSLHSYNSCSVTWLTFKHFATSKHLGQLQHLMFMRSSSAYFTASFPQAESTENPTVKL